MGCGIRHKTGEIFFTHNGHFLGLSPFLARGISRRSSQPF
jgi:hypothetical protein